MNYYDDNFGDWADMDEPEMVEFYRHIQDTNVKKECDGCGRQVLIQPNYSYCNACADKRERGIDF